MKGRDVYVAGIGSFSPGEPIPFDNIEDVLGELTGAPKKVKKRIKRLRPILKQMLGIKYAHYAIDPQTRQPTETNTTMSVKCAQKALQMAKMDASDIDLITYGGIFYDYMCPPNTVMIQEALDIRYCAEISIHSNCTSSYKALQVAADMVSNSRYDTALVVSSQLSSLFLRSEYYNQEKITEGQAILRWFLCDGAGAFVLTSQKPDHPCFKLVDTYLESVGVGIEPSMRMLIGASNSNLPEIYANGLHHLIQDFQVVSKLAPDLFKKGMETMIEKTNFDLTKVKCFFANIPTKHLMDLAIKKLRSETFKNPELVIYTRLATRGYQGPPAVVIALDEYIHNTDLKQGDYIASLVTESSKWMHAGFIMEYCE